ncbi:MAG: LacI family DNA-binding transcriptional regulator, partial [Desulfuromonadales bacterium]|nr:LacI family DNA-binding transcriptional regulator [Desulfuromonadales bacterium]
MKSPSQRAIAKKANVSLASVSFALGSNQSNQEKLSKATRDRILKTAAEMGYQSNPLISTWMAGLRSGRASPPKATLGWINDYPDRDWWNSGPYNRTLRESAIERARELGYTLEDIWLPDMAGVAPEAYVSKCIPILRERGISGVLLPHLDYAARAEVEWPDCAVVVIGKPERLHPHLHETRQQPDARQTLIHHQVNSDFFHNAALAYRSLATAGYRRVGLTISLDHDMASGLLISSAVETETRLMAPDRQVPVFRHKTPLEFEGLDAWIRKCRPDAILAVQAETRK